MDKTFLLLALATWTQPGLKLRFGVEICTVYYSKRNIRVNKRQCSKYTMQQYWFKFGLYNILSVCMTEWFMINTFSWHHIRVSNWTKEWTIEWAKRWIDSELSRWICSWCWAFAIWLGWVLNVVCCKTAFMTASLGKYPFETTLNFGWIETFVWVTCGLLGKYSLCARLHSGAASHAVYTSAHQF